MSNSLTHQLRVFGSVASSTLEAWRGTNVVHQARQPEKYLQLYDMEGSPYCRFVREAFTALGLDVQILPCPAGGKRFRPQAKKLGGKQQFPLLVDPNTGTTMYESADIVNYLFATYGPGSTPLVYRRGPIRPAFSALATAARGLRGIKSRPAKAPEKELHLWSFESSPYSRLVRERLTELELPYVLHNIGKEQWADMGPATMRVKPGPYVPKAGGKREALLARLGRVQVPYLEDPNTGVKMFESRAIVEYLEQTYAVEPQP
ncbi:glutathione S-transferase N-terminal domain-containing protein [Curvibacter sp. APW13]|uniref:glutathione S-transferase N-terminal domain-containing protein n=1 Tax=Curvibacter sp. APW13 TaxID=3077236 RepID=UPI0028DE5D6B|nr:glutathione S-transferase N-terminal domain-containing protein [Curvibacter sp. APW13]MDT8989432.1 glutathione S-transferase N-terminal domain-containing protein [Curvibacter sp. APW13]